MLLKSNTNAKTIVFFFFFYNYIQGVKIKMKFEKFFSLKLEISKYYFFLSVLVKLGSHADTPTDICNAKFGEVTETVK